MFKRFFANRVIEMPNRSDERKSSVYMTREELARYSKEYLRIGPWNDGRIIMSQNYHRPVQPYGMLQGNSSVLLVGGSMNQKHNFMLANILEMNSSYVVVDTERYLYANCKNILEENGYKVKLLNLAHFSESNHYNPLKYVNSDDTLRLFVDSLLDITKEWSLSLEFEACERLLFCACIAYLQDYGKDKPQNLISLREILKTESLDELFNPLLPDSFAKKYYESFKLAAASFAQSIKKSCYERLVWLDAPRIAEMLSKDEFDFERVGQEKTAIFINLAKEPLPLEQIASLFISQLLDRLFAVSTAVGLETGSFFSPVHVDFMLANDGNIGLMPKLEERLHIMRPYNMSVFTFVDTISSLDDMYEYSQSVLANISNHILISAKDEATSDYYLKRLGLAPHVSSFSIKDGHCIVFAQSLKPFYDELYNLSTHPLYEQMKKTSLKNL